MTSSCPALATIAIRGPVHGETTSSLSHGGPRVGRAARHAASTHQALFLPVHGFCPSTSLPPSWRILTQLRLRSVVRSRLMPKSLDGKEDASHGGADG
jgi:hypothetical protein